MEPSSLTLSPIKTNVLCYSFLNLTHTNLNRAISPFCDIKYSKCFILYVHFDQFSACGVCPEQVTQQSFFSHVSGMALEAILVPISYQSDNHNASGGKGQYLGRSGVVSSHSCSSMLRSFRLLSINSNLHGNDLNKNLKKLK